MKISMLKKWYNLLLHLPHHKVIDRKIFMNKCMGFSNNSHFTSQNDYVRQSDNADLLLNATYDNPHLCVITLQVCK